MSAQEPLVGIGGWWPAAGSGALSAAVHHGTFGGGHHYPHHLHHGLALGEAKHSPAQQQEIGLKIH